MKLKNILLMLLIISMPLFYSCRTSSVEQKKKKVEKANEAKDAEALAKYNKALKRHQSIQSKNTKKRMNSNLSNANYTSASQKKQFFLVRWFSKKKKDTPCPASK